MLDNGFRVGDIEVVYRVGAIEVGSRVGVSEIGFRTVVGKGGFNAGKDDAIDDRVSDGNSEVRFSGDIIKVDWSFNIIAPFVSAIEVAVILSTISREGS